MKETIFGRLCSRLRRFWQPGGRGEEQLSFGSLRRLTPISSRFGYDRGTPIRRFYIDKFLGEHADNIRGRVLEVGDDQYIRRYGGDKVKHADVLHVWEGNSHATIIADLTNTDFIPADSFDCLILTQTLQCIWDIHAAIRTMYHIIKPGGVVLASLPGITQVSRYDRERWGDFWRFTSQSARRLFEETFLPENVLVEAIGNVLTASASLYGLAAEDLRPEELAYHDPDYEVLIMIRAYKPGLCDEL
jgi:SAM-dependent methyltransferase